MLQLSLRRILVSSFILFFYTSTFLFQLGVNFSLICGSYLSNNCDASVNPLVNSFQTHTIAQIDASFYQSPTPAIDLDSIPYSESC